MTNQAIQTTLKTNEGLFSKRKSRFCFCSVVAVFLGLLVCITAPVQSRTWYIKADGTGDAPTIQAGVDSAAAGDTVLVAPGTYADTTHVSIDGQPTPVNVHLYKSVRIIGETKMPPSIIDGAESEVIIYVNEVDSLAAVKTLQLRGPEPYIAGCTDLASAEGSRFRPSTGIRCVASPIVIEDNSIRDTRKGVLLIDSPAELTGNEIFASIEGVHCDALSDAVIADNAIWECYTGIMCTDSSPWIVNNRIGSPAPELVCYGIWAIESSAHIENNEIMRAGNYGIAAGGSTLEIRGNALRSHVYGMSLVNSPCNIVNNLLVSGRFGIVVAGSPSGTIANNTIDDHGAGIVCQQGGVPTIRSNIITRVGWGVQCVGSTPVIECNDIFDVTNVLYYGSCAGQNEINGNFSLDPEYCGVDDSGNYRLQSDSPCAPGNHPAGVACGVIGAFPVECGTVNTEEKTWGGVKRLYDEGE